VFNRTKKTPQQIMSEVLGLDFASLSKRVEESSNLKNFYARQKAKTSEDFTWSRFQILVMNSKEVIQKIRIIWIQLTKFVMASMCIRPKMVDCPRSIVIIKNVSRQHLPPAIGLEEYREFLSSPKINLFQEASIIVLENRITKLEDRLHKNLYLTTDVSKILIEVALGVSNRFRFIFFIIRSYSRMARLALVKEIPLSMTHFFIEVGLIKYLSERNLEIVVIDSQGSWLDEPLIFFQVSGQKFARTIMIHYSENSLYYEKSQAENLELVPKFETTMADEHWVWTEEYADYFNSRSAKKNFISKGPLIYREIDSINRESRTSTSMILSSLQISIFDDAPSSDNEWILHSNLESNLSFLGAIEEVGIGLEFEEIDFNFLIKQKRRRIESHSDLYFQELEKIVSNKKWNLVDWNESPASLIRKSEFVICALATSPAIIARHFGVHVCYLYAGSSELGDAPVQYGIPTFRNSSEVVSWILSNIESVKK
jgi:polysaccharide biosynthesis PFTS motif protein